MRSRRTLLAAGLLGLVVVASAGLQGPATFTGLRWRFDGPSPEPPQPADSLVGPTASTAPDLTPAPTPQGSGSGIPTVVLVVVGAIIAIVLLYLLRRWLIRRSPRSAVGLRDVGMLTAPPEAVVEPEQEPEPEVEAPAVLRGVEEALRLLDSERQPGDAVLKAWLGLERSAEQSDVRRRLAETPTEFTRRILSRVSADDRAVGDLLSLYLRARFGEHPVTASDVARARAALEALARSWDHGAAVPPTVRARSPRSAGSTTWPT